MKVAFKNSFFIDGYLFDKGVSEVPEHFRDRLPTTAKVLDEAVAAPEPAVLDDEKARKMAEIRAAARNIDQSNPDNQTARGDIKTQAFFAVMGWEPTRSEINEALGLGA